MSYGKARNAQIEEPAEKAYTDSRPGVRSAGANGVVQKRPFVLDKARGTGGGNMALMLMVLGAVVVFGIGMLAFLSTKGTAKKKTAAEAANPSLGRVAGPTAPGRLDPDRQGQTISGRCKEGRHSRRGRHRKDQGPKGRPGAGLEDTERSNWHPAPQSGAKFEEPDTTPTGSKWTPPPYSAGQNEQQSLRKEEEALNQPSLVFTAHVQSNGFAPSRERHG